ncbi:MAG: hypothetical protein IIX77_05370 [Oscillospiraceae bacterium]|nr:hypothetical protein [Oscillospiraceae bacterium]
MILHTPLSYGMILDILNEEYQCEYCRIDGILCQTVNGCVSRVISTDPYVFLKTNLTPGTKLPLQRGTHGNQKEKNCKTSSCQNHN